MCGSGSIQYYCSYTHSDGGVATVVRNVQCTYLWVKLARKLFQSTKSFTQVDMSAVKKNTQQRVSGT